VPETLSLGKRSGFYEQTGAYRDMVVTHLFQILGFMAMEAPTSLEPNPISEEKNKVFRSMLPIRSSDVVRGQYTGYRTEEGVSSDSDTETFIALRSYIDNWRWAGVPFYIRAGKRMPKRATEIRIQFKKPPHLTFGRDAAKELDPNAITLRIQPEEGISLRFGAKVPSAGIKLRSVTMDFEYATSFLVETPEAYERLLLDCMIGDPTLFTRADEVEAAWKLIDPVEAAWRDDRPPLHFYEAGTWGPAAAAKLLEQDAREWHRP
jgi:glucose-6-phosphate 1-dehydrogenase